MSDKMRDTLTTVVLLLACAASAFAQADRESLVEAWETYMAGLPGTAAIEDLGDGRYRLEDTELPYEGEIKLVGALVRPVDSAGMDTGFSQFGMVEFELTDLPAERLTSQSYYYWQSRKARGLMDESAAINQQARENLDRTQAMQDEVLAIARATRDLHVETNDILKNILFKLQR